ncbi:MAG: flagellar motor switch protein FliG [Treponema sp.]|nr:flagellar motor switch protein FliG [Treponema sp.]
MEEEQIQGFFKTTPEPLQSAAEEKTESKFRRVAKFLMLIGSDRAAEILGRLPPDQIEAISGEIASIRSIGTEESRAVLEEFSSLLSSPYQILGACTGGIETARRVLYAAFGPEKGEELLVRAVPEAKPNPFDFLEDFSGDQLALLFREESPAAAALVFSRLPPKQSAQALSRITGDKKVQILKRIAKQAAVSPEVLEQVAGALREKAKKISEITGKGNEANFNGMEALAAILKSSDMRFGDKILNKLEIEDPELGKTLKDKVHTIVDLLDAPDLPIQKKLAGMNDRDIILLLKARTGYEDTADFREKILSNLSQGKREEILEEEGIVGAVPRRDVEQAAAEFLAWFRQERENGGIVMMNDTDLVI